MIIDISQDSLNVDSSGALTAVIFGAATFDVALIDVASVRFAGAAAWQWRLVDANNDGLLDLQLKFRREDTILEQVYTQLLEDDFDADGVLDSSGKIAEIAVTGRTLDGMFFTSSDDISLFLSGRALRELLDQLFD